MQGPGGSSFAYETFTPVNPRKKRKGKVHKHAISPLELLARVTEEIATDGGWASECGGLLQMAVRDMRIKPKNVLCLGLGSPCSSRDARAQLAFLNQICAFSDMDSASVSVYDPVFTDTDRELFQDLGIQLRHSLDGPTILYMPHCDLKLYEIVIRANWSYQRLCDIMFLANRFSDYIDNNLVSTLEKESPCLMRLVPFVESRPLPTSTAFPTAFNNLSLQYVRRTPLSLEDNAFWEIPPSRDLPEP
ncbi:hypothetical protein BU15DRAFT_85244 [Melanogaster broomeanus]|nr:hypothetical protein BU15DRAFT_85244 [Melanogaster broomeanus]